MRRREDGRAFVVHMCFGMNCCTQLILILDVKSILDVSRIDWITILFIVFNRFSVPVPTFHHSSLFGFIVDWKQNDDMTYFLGGTIFATLILEL